MDGELPLLVSAPRSPRELVLREVSVSAACRANGLWHSRLPVILVSNVVRNPWYVCYSADWRGWSYGVAIWSTPVAANRMRDGHTCGELRRLAIAPNAPRYTASWMLGRMVRDIKRRFPWITYLVSYQDTAVHRGVIYRAAGWVADGFTRYRSWGVTRVRNASQSAADKVRWIFPLSGARVAGRA